MARTYRRDSNGRFASGGGSSGPSRKGVRQAPRGPNRLTRDNAGRITSVGGQGATARGGRLRTASGNRRATQVARIGGKRGRLLGGKGGGAAVMTKRYKKVDLSQSAFERRAKATEKRARAAERAVAGADRGYASKGTRRMFRTADALRSAADSYSSYSRRGKTGEFSAAHLFNTDRRLGKRTTAPKLTKSEKAARTRAANADKRFRENVRRMEQARRYS